MGTTTKANDQVILSPELQHAFRQFLESTPPERLNRHLRTMFLEWIRQKEDLPAGNFKESVDDLMNLFDLLDKAGQAA